MSDELNQPNEVPTTNPESEVEMEQTATANTPEHKTHVLSLVLLSLLAVAVLGAYWYSNTIGVAPVADGISEELPTEEFVSEEGEVSAENAAIAERLVELEEFVETSDATIGENGEIVTEPAEEPSSTEDRMARLEAFAASNQEVEMQDEDIITFEDDTEGNTADEGINDEPIAE